MSYTPPVKELTPEGVDRKHPAGDLTDGTGAVQSQCCPQPFPHSPLQSQGSLLLTDTMEIVGAEGSHTRASRLPPPGPAVRTARLVSPNRGAHLWIPPVESNLWTERVKLTCVAVLKKSRTQPLERGTRPHTDLSGSLPTS